MVKGILIIGFVWPEPSSTAAGVRMLQLLRFFKSQGYSITFASTATETEFSLDLTSLGVAKEAIRLNHFSFDDLIKKLHPEIVLFDRFMVEEQFGWRVAKQLPNTLRILDTEDLHSLRSVRKKAFNPNLEFSLDSWLRDDMTKREIASIFRSDLSLIISGYEMQLLQEVLKIEGNLLLHLPFMVNAITENDTGKWLSFEKRADFVCIGNGKHAPNVDAIVWLKKEIWPLIHKALPKSRLYVYGSYLPNGVKQLHRPKEGFMVMGRAASSQEVVGSARISLAPLRFGAGIKGKLTESMLCGTPSVTTVIGAEGMHGDFPWNGKIEDGPEAFAEAAIQLYTDRTIWITAQQKGITLINKYYNKEMLTDRLSSKIADIQDDLETHRCQNFIGSMLMHHTMASTKYLAKWIAAKNK